MRTAIATDTNSGITPDQARDMGIGLVPMPILIDGEVRFEGVDITEDEFYEAIGNGVSVTTSQPSPGDLRAVWDRMFESGADRIVYIPMSAKLSKSCEMAQITAQAFDGRVEVVDNRRISVTQRTTVNEAIAMVEDGAEAPDIRSFLERRAGRTSIYLAVDSLDHLVRGGRVSPAVAALGSMLKIKPVLTIQNREIEPYAKERGMKKAMTRMLAAAKENADRMMDSSSEELVVGVAAAGVGPEREQELIQAARDTFPGTQIIFDRIPFSIAAHTGPGAMGVGFHLGMQ
ncbi:MAG: DegV family protein [Collinsella sp.]|nr:DegV family protein [Collinsella sp.]